MQPRHILVYAHRSTTMEPGTEEQIPPGQEIDFCTLGMFIIGKMRIFFSRFIRVGCLRCPSLDLSSLNSIFLYNAIQLYYQITKAPILKGTRLAYVYLGYAC